MRYFRWAMAAVQVGGWLAALWNITPGMMLDADFRHGAVAAAAGCSALWGMLVWALGEAEQAAESRARAAEADADKWVKSRLAMGRMLDALRNNRGALAYVQAREIGTLMWGWAAAADKFPKAGEFIDFSSRITRAAGRSPIAPLIDRTESPAVAVPPGLGNGFRTADVGSAAGRGGHSQGEAAREDWRPSWQQSGPASGPGRGTDGFITMDDRRACRECMGAGTFFAGKDEPCNRCGGSGLDPAPRYLLDGNRGIYWKTILALFSTYVDECGGSRAAARGRFHREILPRLSVNKGGTVPPAVADTVDAPARVEFPYGTPEYNRAHPENPQKWGLNPDGSPTVEWTTPGTFKDHPAFDALFGILRSWDIHVAGAYAGYCAANGNHVRAIIEGLENKGFYITPGDGVDTNEDWKGDDVGELQDERDRLETEVASMANDAPAGGGTFPPADEVMPPAAAPESPAGFGWKCANLDCEKRVGYSGTYCSAECQNKDQAARWAKLTNPDAAITDNRPAPGA